MSTDEQRLRAAMTEGLPRPPAAPGLGARLAVRARRRRAWRRTGGAVGAGLLSLTVIAVVLTLSPERDATTEPPIATTPSTPAEPETPHCDDPATGVVDGDPVVPGGAVAVRLCGGQVDNGGLDLAWPADTLRGPAVDRLVAHLNGLQPYVRPDGCTLPASPPFDLVLAYPDGDRVRLHGDTAGTCEHVSVTGGSTWSGAPGTLAAVLRLIDEQRADQGRQATLMAPSCPTSWNAVASTAGAAPVGPDARVAVTACRYVLDDVAPGQITQSADGVLEAEATVTAPSTFLRMVAEGSRTDPCGGVAYDLDRTQDVLLVRDGFGDVQVVPTEPCWGSELTGQRRYPSEQLAEAVAVLLDQRSE